jgi:hypothetical protein
MQNSGRFQKVKSKAKHVRFYQIFIAMSIIITVYAIYVGKPAPTKLYTPDSWAQMSISVGAAALTVVAIIASIVVSNENNKRAEMTDSLTIISNKIEEKKRLNPDRSLDNIYDSSKNAIDDAIARFSPMKYFVSLIGFMSFIVLLWSAFSAIFGYSFAWILASFLFGVYLLLGYVLYVVDEFLIMDRLSSSAKRKGELTMLAMKINGVLHKPAIKDKKGTIKANQLIERVEFKLRFNGNVKNGFLHATVKYVDGNVSYIPDANTFLCLFGFANDFRLVLLEKDLDTGVLQMKGSIDLSFELILRSRKRSEINPLIGTGFIDRLGMQEIYKQCSIENDVRIAAIELRMYEDPFYKQNFKRREVDCITLQVTEPEPI